MMNFLGFGYWIRSGRAKLTGKAISNCIFMVVVCLMAMGVVFVFSASMSIERGIEWERFYDFACLRQILFFPFAILTMYMVSKVDYRRFSLTFGWLKSPIIYLLAISIGLLILVLVPSLGVEVNRARRWFRFSVAGMNISFQPSELAKWVVIFFLAGMADKFGRTIDGKRFVVACLVLGIIVGLVIVEDFGTAAFILLLGVLMLVMVRVRWQYIFSVLGFGGVGLIITLICSPGRMQRIVAFLWPQKWADSAFYQAKQSLIAIGSGGLWGKGLGRGICKYGYLPADTTDFIFAIICEELGFMGAVAVIGLFIAFVWLGVEVVLRTEERFGRILAGGIVLAIAMQAAINIAVVTAMLPTKGIPLPFVSAGGTSMLLSAGAVGVLLNIARQSNLMGRCRDEICPAKLRKAE